MSPEGESVHRRWSGSGAGEVKVRVSTSIHRRNQWKEDCFSPTPSEERYRFRDGRGVTGGVGLPPAADVRDAEEVDSGLLQGSR